MPQSERGPWKEGRVWAASLCYTEGLPADFEPWLANHRAVGIRATSAYGEPSAQFPALAQLNWDLALNTPQPDAALLEAMGQCDQRASRGLLAASSTPPDPRWQYTVAEQPGDVPPPGGRAADTPSSAEALASRIAPSSADVWCAAIESGRAAQRWTIWRLDLAALERLGHAGHRHVLRWLGDHHDQVWCAPVRDIAAYRGAAPHGGV